MEYIRITGTWYSAITPAISLSARRALTSFTASAPASSDWRATSAFQVSTEIQISLSERTSFISGITRRSSSSNGTSVLPGPEDSPPISSQSAPSAIIFLASDKASSYSKKLESSENESGVVLSIPIRIGRDSFKVFSPETSVREGNSKSV